MEDGMIRTSLIAAGLTLSLASALSAEVRPVLHVYTYDSFATDWGPGPAVKAAFEADCACDLVFVTAADGAALLSRLRLEGARTPADVVLGLDTMLTAAAADTGLFAPHGLTTSIDIPNPSGTDGTWADPLFVPFDWGYFAFVYDTTRLQDVPQSFEALAAAPDDLKIVIQDPRSSTPGLGLVYWVKAAYGDRAPEIWTGLAPHILTVTPGWAEAYGLFLDGEADMVLSYTTSPAYHLNAEDDATKAAAIFTEGHYMQIEVAGMLASSDQPALARSFLEFLLSEAVQSVIPTTNWMYPARAAGALPPGFDQPVGPDGALLLDAGTAQAIRDEAIGEWQAGLSR
jgi:thiamine transport system substrate-binding protein